MFMNMAVYDHRSWHIFCKEGITGHKGNLWHGDARDFLLKVISFYIGQKLDRELFRELPPDQWKISSTAF